MSANNDAVSCQLFLEFRDLDFSTMVISKLESKIKSMKFCRADANVRPAGFPDLFIALPVKSMDIMLCLLNVRKTVEILTHSLNASIQENRVNTR